MNFASITTASTMPMQRPARRTHSNAGFSLLEMAIVVALVMIVGVISLVLAKNVVRSVHLHQTASNYSNLLQQARVRAVRDDNYYSVKTVAASGGRPAYAFIDINQSGTFASGDPIFYFNADVKPVTNTSGLNVTNLRSQYLPAGYNATINPSTAEGPTFGPRGLPCSPSSLTGGTCPFLATPIAYEIFMKNTSSLNYEAVTVTPAGRIHLWSHGSSGTWSPMN